MALPARVLDRLPPGLRQNGLLSTGDQLSPPISSGKDPAPPWERALLEGDWPQGTVSELSLSGGFAGGTSLALNACCRVQSEGRNLFGEPHWCAFIDPADSLHAPGVQSAGVDLSYLLVLRPSLEDISRVALRLLLSRSVPLVIIDLVGSPSAPLDVHLGHWVKVVRRMTSVLESTEGRALLLTLQQAPRSLPLPVSARLELSRQRMRQLDYHVARSPQGQWSTSKKIPFTAHFTDVERAKANAEGQGQKWSCRKPFVGPAAAQSDLTAKSAFSGNGEQRLFRGAQNPLEERPEQKKAREKNQVA